MHPGHRPGSHPSDNGPIAVTLVCISCSREQTIHIPRNQAAGCRIYWECFHCQDGAPAEPAPRGTRTAGKRGGKLPRQGRG
jgi:hypothetical protein